MNRIHRTWSLMSACWQILKQDKAQQPGAGGIRGGAAGNRNGK